MKNLFSKTTPSLCLLVLALSGCDNSAELEARSEPVAAAATKAGEHQADEEGCDNCDCEHLEEPAHVPKDEVATYALIPDANRPSSGPDDASITITVFSDFQCPFCKRADGTLAELEKIYDGDIRFVYRQLPLEFHARAKDAALASLAADRQGKYVEMSDYLYAHQDELNTADFSSIAKELGLDVAQFERDLQDDNFLAQIDENIALGKKHDIRGTPSFTINGRIIKGARPLEQFQTFIESEKALMTQFQSSYRGPASKRLSAYIASRSN